MSQRAVIAIEVFLPIFEATRAGGSLDYRLETLAFCLGMVYGVRRTDHETMLTNHYTPTSIGEATSVALSEPCWHSLDPRHQFGNVQALAGRYVR